MKVKRVLLINPPYERLKGFSVESVPLGLLYIGTVLKKAGHVALVYDADTDFSERGLEYTNINRTQSQHRYVEAMANRDHPVWDELRNVIKGFSPDIIGVTMMTPVYSSCRTVLEIVKQERPEAVLLAGGPHVTITQKKALADNPELDFAFVGEGERSIVQFMQAYEAGAGFASVEGLIYRDKNGITFNGRAARIDDLDGLPIPDREILYNKDKYYKDRFSLMVASRGCPFSCAFCAIVPVWEKKVRFRSPQNVVAEIDHLIDRYKVRSFGLWDDTFTSNRRYLMEFCGLIEKRYGSKLVWDCLSSVNCLDNAVVVALKRSGCRRIKIGVESGSDEVLKKIRKNITTQQVLDVADIVRRHGIWLHAYFMLGMPYETENDIRKTIDFIKALNPDSINLCTYMPYPGTELYDYIISRGLMEPDHDYKIYDHLGHHSPEGFFVPDIDRQRYGALLKEALKLATRLSNSYTLRKVLMKVKMATPDRFRRAWHQVAAACLGQRRDM